MTALEALEIYCEVIVFVFKWILQPLCISAFAYAVLRKAICWVKGQKEPRDFFWELTD